MQIITSISILALAASVAAVPMPQYYSGAGQNYGDGRPQNHNSSPGADLRDGLRDVAGGIGEVVGGIASIPGNLIGPVASLPGNLLSGLGDGLSSLGSALEWGRTVDGVEVGDKVAEADGDVVGAVTPALEQ